MSLKYKTKVYFSLRDDLLEFVQEQSHILNMTKSKYVTNILLKEYGKYRKNKIDKIIEGAEI